ncbi:MULTISPECIES: LysM peptidoglycan-binding domain-containing protein [Listeria]|uniref:LysM peptidoglycan-binding domain-containing protein n=1 Tax=Listeria TaxID=1637 RepID=UPI000B5921B5|nr:MULTISPECIES: LysM peptidoglycan-binding domain-containing protein [Listeria]
MKKATIATATAGIAVTAFAAPTIASASSVVVESGDTLWGIAEANDTTVDSLKQLNNLDSDKIFPGQKLVVSEVKEEKSEKSVSATWLNVRKGPSVDNQIVTSLKGGTKVTVESTEANGWNKITFADGKTGYVNGKFLGEAKVAAPAPKVEKETTQPASEQKAAPVVEEANLSTYTVKSGDTLWALSVKFGTSVQNIMSWNNLSSSSIYVGQNLAVKESAAKTVAPKQATTAPAETSQVAEKETTKAPAAEQVAVPSVDVNASSYTVKSGDSLSKIAGLFGTSVANLKALNNLSSDAIVVGDVLKVKGEVKAAAPAQTEKAEAPKQETTTQAPAKVETPQAPSINTNASSYTVRSGDSLSKIASIFGTSVSKLKALNGLTSDNLQVGQVLKVKGTVPATNVSTPTNTTSNTSKPSQNTNTGSSQASSSSSYSALIAEAQKHLGKSYSWGGNGPTTFDCSGYTKYVFSKIGVNLSRTSGSQYAQATKVSAAQAKPGDLVFFDYGSGISHVGIYVGGGQMINAQNAGVKYDNIYGTGWGKYLVGFGRVANF